MHTTRYEKFILIALLGLAACTDASTAKGPTGRPVSVVVCGGFLKSATVRFD